MGPNYRRLIAERAAQIQIEKTKCAFGVADVGAVTRHILDTQAKSLSDSMREAVIWAKNAMLVAHGTPGSEEWPDDESMAAEILRRAHERQVSQEKERYDQKRPTLNRW